MKLASGSLDRLLILYSRDVTEAPGGQRVASWTPRGALYGERLEMRTVDAARAGQRDTYAIGRFLIRYRRDLTTAHRLVIDGQTFDILAIDEPDRRTSMILTVEQATDPIS